jgi:hypothetical protein
MTRRKGTIQSRSPGSFRIRYSLGSDPVTGKRRWATATVQGSRKDAERELTRRLRTVDTSEHVDPSRMSVAGWLKLWLVSTQTEVSPKTQRALCRDRAVLSGASIGRLGIAATDAN